ARDVKDAIVGHDDNKVNTTTYTTPAINTSSYTTPTYEKTTVTSTTSTPSRPLTEKITAPVVGAASAVGAAAAGTAAYVGDKARDVKDAIVGHGDNNYNNNNNLYTSTTSTTSYNDIRATSPIPSAYKGPIPKAGPGEEIVWVKTVTTTEYHDTDKGLDTHGDVVETHQDILDPNRFQVEHDNVITYVNDGHGGKIEKKST
ncbi:hypothetical protein BGZ94_009108, partial [Podila epigama]